MNRKVLVSIHDVWPGNLPAVEHHLEWLRGHGVGSVALMVVPFYHGKKPLDQESAFQVWLKEKQIQGAEIFMHGYRHLMPEALGENTNRTWFGKWLNRRVQNEGEFAGLDPGYARKLLQKGLEIFSKAGIEPVGYTMPAWLGKIPHGFDWPGSCRFFDGRFYLWDQTAQKCHWSPVLTFGRNPLGVPFIYGGNSWSMYLNRVKLARIALHPGDLENENVRRAVENVLKRRETASHTHI